MRRNSPSSKRGMVLPIVISFMLLSQLMYWGLLHLNQTHSQHLVALQDYYQAMIQQTLAYEFIEFNQEQQLLEFEPFITEQLNRNINAVNSLSNTYTWHLQTPQLGIASKTNDSYHWFVYYQEIYIGTAIQHPEELFNNIQTHGWVQSDNSFHYYQDETLLNQSFQDLNEIKESLQQNQYIQTDTQSHHYQSAWSPQIYFDDNYLFSNGMSYQELNKGDITIINHVYGRNFTNYTRLLSPEKIPFIVKWTGYWYEKSK